MWRYVVIDWNMLEMWCKMNPLEIIEQIRKLLADLWDEVEELLEELDE